MEAVPSAKNLPAKSETRRVA
jgi:hypothetical protein